MGSTTASLQVIEHHQYQHHIFGGPHVLAFLSSASRVAVIVDQSLTEADLPLAGLRSDPGLHAAMGGVLVLLERLLQCFDYVVGRRPELKSPFHGRVRVEVGHIDAAGLAHHGVYGIAVGPAFLQAMLDGQRTGRNVVHQVFGYEFCRNYIFPEQFTACLDYCCANGACPTSTTASNGSGRPACACACAAHPDSWGWVNQGMVDMLGCLLMDPECPYWTPQSLPVCSPVHFEYYGQDRPQFRGDMEANVATYQQLRGHASIGGAAGPQAVWLSVFRHDRLLWRPEQSLDNLYAGILSMLYQHYGRFAFLRRFFAALPILRHMQRQPKNKSDWQTAAENFYLACCFGAGQDLDDLFSRVWMWPVRPGVGGSSHDVTVCDTLLMQLAGLLAPGAAS